MTPTEHAAAVDAFIARAADANLTRPNPDDFLEAEIRARLSIAAGTGAAYTAADEALAEAETSPARFKLLALAKVHAARAE